MFYVFTNVNIKFKTLKPISDTKVAVQLVERKSTLTARPARPIPIARPPQPSQPKPKEKPKEIAKPAPQKTKPKPEVKNPQQKQIIVPKLSPVPTPEPRVNEVASNPAIPTNLKNTQPATAQTSSQSQGQSPQGISLQGQLSEGQSSSDIFAMSPGDISIPEYYVGNARLLIMSHFNVPSYLRNTDAQCRVSFTVLRDGSITNIKIDKSSGNGILDMVALRAIQDTGSLAPLPDEIKNPSLNVVVTFDFNYAE
jgi:protein TonB